MPRFTRRRRTRTRRRKRPTFRKRRRRNFMSKITFEKTNGFLPDQQYLKMRAVKRYVLDDGSSTIINRNFLINGITDIDPIESGFRPLGFDQWAQLYKRYKVLGSSISINYVIQGAEDVDLVLYPANDIQIAVSAIAARQKRFAKHKIITNGVTAVLQGKLRNYISTRKMEAGSTDSINFHGSNTANPLRLFYWHILTQNIIDGETLNGVVDIRLTYYVKWFQPLDIDPS